MLVWRGCMFAATGALAALTLGCASESIMTSVVSPSFDQYKEEYERSNSDIAVEKLKEAATQGDRRAQVELGLKYADGEDIPQHYLKAVVWFRKAATHNDPVAQYQLGFMYANGRGVEQNDAEAVKWYEKAVEQNHLEAQYQLGLMYANGRGVEQNDAEAVKWYEKAVEQNHLETQYQLGLMYANGRGVEQNDAEAVKWYEKAVEQNHLEAQYQLGLMYANGRGVEQSDAEAVKWYEKAAKEDFAEAQNSLGIMYESGRGVEQNDTEAARWYQEAAEKGIADAQNNLGIMYENGQGVEQSDAEALRWYREAAGKGVEVAQYNLGRMFSLDRGVPENYMEVEWYQEVMKAGKNNADVQYQFGRMHEKGRGVDPNDVKAIVWYQKAAEKGHIRAQSALGNMHYQGRGVEQNYAEAAKWYQKAAEKGHTRAQSALGIMHFKGQGVDQNYAEAVKWYRSAADQGHANAQIMVGYAYDIGLGVKEDDAEAAKWYRMAAEQEHDFAQTALGDMYYEGQGVKQDHAEAAKLYRIAAKQGHVGASYKLARMIQDFAEALRDAQTVPDIRVAVVNALDAEIPTVEEVVRDFLTESFPDKDKPIEWWILKISKDTQEVDDVGESLTLEAAQKLADAVRKILNYKMMEWFEVSAERGYAKAEFQLGRILEDYRRLPEAVKWYRQAAEQNHTEAQLNLGRMYEYGLGVLRNRVHAHMWYNLVASQSQESVTSTSARLGRERVEDRLNADEIAEAQRLAEEQKLALSAVAGDSIREYPFSARYPAGSGFWISTDGYLLTNAHVVRYFDRDKEGQLEQRDCDQVYVGKSGPARVRALDGSIDLALLQVQHSVEAGEVVAKFRSSNIRVGDEAVVVGYPLQGLYPSSEAKVTQGIVSALSGPHDDDRRIQIDVAVNSGNSGGPVLDASGNVIGVAVEKRISKDGGKRAKEGKEVFQNVNHAVSLGAVKLFLDDVGIRYETAPSNERVEVAEVAAIGRQFAVLVECRIWQSGVPKWISRL